MTPVHLHHTCGLSRSSRRPIRVPVAALRFTHHSVNADLAFGESHGNRQNSILKMIDGLFQDHLQPEDMCLNVFLHTGPDGIKGLFSRDNRCLFALLCYQAVRRDIAIRAPCRIYLDNDRRPSPMENLSLIRWSPSVPRQCPQHQETHSHSKCSTPCLYHNHQRENTLTRVPEGARRNVLSPTS